MGGTPNAFAACLNDTEFQVVFLPREGGIYAPAPPRASVPLDDGNGPLEVPYCGTAREFDDRALRLSLRLPSGIETVRFDLWQNRESDGDLLRYSRDGGFHRTTATPPEVAATLNGQPISGSASRTQTLRVSWLQGRVSLRSW